MELHPKLQEIQERLDGTQPGPWRYYKEDRDHEGGSDFIMTGDGTKRGEDLEILGSTEGDMEFIGHAKQDIEFLLRIITELSL